MFYSEDVWFLLSKLELRQIYAVTLHGVNGHLCSTSDFVLTSNSVFEQCVLLGARCAVACVTVISDCDFCGVCSALCLDSNCLLEPCSRVGGRRKLTNASSSSI